MDLHSSPGHLQETTQPPQTPSLAGTPIISRVSPGLCRGEQLTQRAFLLPQLSQGPRPQPPGCQAGTADSLSVSIAPLQPSSGPGASAQQLQESGRRGHGEPIGPLGAEATPVAGSQLSCCTGWVGGLPRGTLPQGLPKELVLSLGPQQEGLRWTGSQRSLEPLLITAPSRECRSSRGIR